MTAARKIDERPEEHRCLTREEAARELRISLYLLDRERAAGE